MPQQAGGTIMRANYLAIHRRRVTVSSAYMLCKVGNEAFGILQVARCDSLFEVVSVN